MARYIDDILQPGEKVLYSTTIHWLVHLPGILCWIVAIAFLALVRFVTNETGSMAALAAAAVSAAVALSFTLRAWFRRWTTEIDVTNLRVVHKTGFIRRKTFEISIDKVASVEVNQSVLGRMFNYGDVTIETMGEDAEPIRFIARPLAFRSTITAR